MMYTQNQTFAGLMDDLFKDKHEDWGKWYSNSWQARKAIDFLVLDSLSKGWDVIFDNKNEKHSQIEKLKEKAKDLDIATIIKDALILERLFGGAIIIAKEKGCKSPALPLSIGVEIEKFMVFSEKDISLSVVNKNSIFENDKIIIKIGNEVIHTSRCIILHGQDPESIRPQNKVFSNSFLKHLVLLLSNCNVSSRSTINAMLKCATTIVTTENLININSEMLTSLQETLKEMNGHSTAVLPEGVEVTNTSVNLSGFHETELMYHKLLAAALSTSVSSFLGITSSGLGQTNAGDLEQGYNRIEEYRQSRVKKPLKEMYNMIYISMFGNNSIVKNLDIEFPSLWNLSEDQIIKNKKENLEIIEKGMTMGVLSDDDIVNNINTQDIFVTPVQKQSFDSLDEDEDIDVKDSDKDSNQNNDKN